MIDKAGRSAQYTQGKVKFMLKGLWGEGQHHSEERMGPILDS